MSILRYTLCCVAAAAATSAFAAEIHSNGEGGGPWTAASTWHGGRVPSTADVAVVAMRDTVVFDGAEAEGLSCRALYIDPEGAFTFKAGDQRLALTVAGPVESYGAIRIDATESPRAVMELRLGGPAPADRVLRLMKGASFLAYGTEGMATGARNVRVSAVSPADGSTRLPVVLIAGEETMVDIHFSRLADVVIEASGLDNTGARSRERLNILGNQFTGLARVSLTACDTPTIRNNRFQSSRTPLEEPAIAVNLCKLAEIRGNRIEGSGYTHGVRALSDVDASIAENVISDCGIGVAAQGNNVMIKDDFISGASTGLRLDGAVAVVENVAIEKAAAPLHLSKSSAQLTSLRVGEGPADAPLLALESSAVTLLNANIGADRIRTSGPAPAGGWVESMQYLIVKVSGKLPAATEVAVRTAAVSGGVPVGKADLNVRNSPAFLSAEGLTPLPSSLKPLIVRSWRIGADGKKVNAPFYDLTLSSRPTAAGEQPKMLKTQVIEPTDAWFRAEPNKTEATVEVTLP
jgi:hypothetical protein